MVPIKSFQNWRKYLELLRCTRPAVAMLVCAVWMAFIVEISYFTPFNASSSVSKENTVPPYIAKIQLKLFKYALFVTFESK